MTLLTLNEDAPEKYKVIAKEAINVISDDFLEVCATKSYVRISSKKQYSIYFWPDKDNKILVDIEGDKSLSSFMPYAKMYWGKVSFITKDRNDKKIYYWRLDSDCFFQTINSVMTQSTVAYNDDNLIENIDIINEQSLLSYEKKALVKQRIGHSHYALKVKERAQYSCEINSSFKRNLIASHIKPWAECINEEKIDVANGLCLSPNFDGLFEDGLIGFDSNGVIQIGALSREEMLVYGLSGKETIKVVNSQKKYLKWHLDNKFKLNKK